LDSYLLHEILNYLSTTAEAMQYRAEMSCIIKIRRSTYVWSRVQWRSKHN